MRYLWEWLLFLSCNWKQKYIHPHKISIYPHYHQTYWYCFAFVNEHKNMNWNKWFGLKDWFCSDEFIKMTAGLEQNTQHSNADNRQKRSILANPNQNQFNLKGDHSFAPQSFDLPPPHSCTNSKIWPAPSKNLTYPPKIYVPQLTLNPTLILTLTLTPTQTLTLT